MLSNLLFLSPAQVTPLVVRKMGPENANFSTWSLQAPLFITSQCDLGTWLVKVQGARVQSWGSEHLFMSLWEYVTFLWCFSVSK